MARQQRKGVNFTNMFMLSFYMRRFQKRKRTNALTVIFVLLGSTRAKPWHTMLMKLTRGRGAVKKGQPMDKDEKGHSIT